MKYYAKSDSYDGNSVLNSDHLKEVSKLCGMYAASFGMEVSGQAAGLCHDAGKYSELFQKVLSGDIHGIDHALPGVFVLADLLGLKTLLKQDSLHSVAECIAAHHGHLQPFSRLWAYVCSFHKEGCRQCPSGKMASLPDTASVKCALDAFLEDLGDCFSLNGITSERFPCTGRGWQDDFLYMQRTRYLLSCLVDADWSMSAYRESGDVSAYMEGDLPDVAAMQEALSSYRSMLQKASKADPSLNKYRNQVFGACVEAGADLSCRLFTLTAPTGLGKTLAMIGFGLSRLQADPAKKRIIIVLPYLSISDQTEEELRHITDAFLVDNSMAHREPEERVLSGRYTSPVVLTTTVQFFGSMFSDNPSDLRKIHRYGDAIILLDEVQALPFGMLRLCTCALQYLAEHCNAAVVMSTATPPAYRDIPDFTYHGREIIPDPDRLFKGTIRTGFSFRDHPQSLEKIAKEASGCRNACVIVNLRKHARIVYDIWGQDGVCGIYLLSTDICPADRRMVLKEIKERQASGDAVHVVSTQCIEAGVDLDFAQIFSAMAPLPSLFQRAGRMNRHGLFAKQDMVIFETDEEGRQYPGAEYEKQSLCVKTMQKDHVDVHTLQGIREYFVRQFYGFAERVPLRDALSDRDYGTFAKESALICTKGAQVVVPSDPDFFEKLRGKAENMRVTKADLVEAMPYCVSSYDKDGICAHCSEILLPNGKNGTAHHTNIWILLRGHETCYSKKTGLCFGNVPFDCIIL